MTDTEIKSIVAVLSSSVAELAQLLSGLMDRLARLEAQAEEKEIKA